MVFLIDRAALFCICSGSTLNFKASRLAFIEQHKEVRSKRNRSHIHGISDNQRRPLAYCEVCKAVVLPHMTEQTASNRLLMKNPASRQFQMLGAMITRTKLSSDAARGLTNLHIPPKVDPAHDTPLCASRPWWSSSNAAGLGERVAGRLLAKATRVSVVLSRIFWRAAGSIP